MTRGNRNCPKCGIDLTIDANAHIWMRNGKSGMVECRTCKACKQREAVEGAKQRSEWAAHRDPGMTGAEADAFLRMAVRRECAMAWEKRP